MNDKLQHEIDRLTKEYGAAAIYIAVVRNFRQTQSVVAVYNPEYTKQITLMARDLAIYIKNYEKENGKIAAIGLLRSITGLYLKDAKEAVEYLMQWEYE